MISVLMAGGEGGGGMGGVPGPSPNQFPAVYTQTRQSYVVGGGEGVGGMKYM